MSIIHTWPLSEVTSDTVHNRSAERGRGERVPGTHCLHIHVWTWSPRNSMVNKCMHKQCVPGTLSPPPSSVPGNEAICITSTICLVYQGIGQVAYKKNRTTCKFPSLVTRPSLWWMCMQESIHMYMHKTAMFVRGLHKLAPMDQLHVRILRYMYAIIVITHPGSNPGAILWPLSMAIYGIFSFLWVHVTSAFYRVIHYSTYRKQIESSCYWTVWKPRPSDKRWASYEVKNMDGIWQEN